MRIVKEGKIPNKKVILKCPECGTIFEADDGEYARTKVVNFNSFEAYRNKYESVCPLCRHEGEMYEMQYKWVEV